MTVSNEPKATQTIKNVKVARDINQISDTQATDQEIDRVSAESVNQKISGERHTLQFGKYSASGKWGIIALVLIFAAYFTYKYYN